ncbi:MAG: hypothetical protein OHK0046_51600 [Anaerolineae bacterium]
MLIVKDRVSGEVIAQGSVEDGSVVVVENCWYFDPACVDQRALTVTRRTYTCPYKGICYWIDLETEDNAARNIAFVYDVPKTGYERIAGRIGFYGRDTSGTVSVIED